MDDLAGSLVIHKSLLRNEMKKRRAGFAQGKPLAGDILAEIAGEWFERRGWPLQTTVVAGYWPIQSEINPLSLMQIFEERGYALALPCLVPEGDGFRMIFRRFGFEDKLVSGPFDIRQPAETCTEILPDMVLLPLLGFDSTGYRLGYGGGYYDRALADLRTHKAIRAYGVAFSGQQLAGIPFEVHDQRLDGIFTDQDVVEARFLG